MWRDFMFQTTQLIYDTLRQNDGLKVFTEEDGKSSRVWLQFGIQNGGRYRIEFINTDNGTDTAIRIFDLVIVSPDKIEKILVTLNALNCKYRYAKFTLTKENGVNIEYDYPVSGKHPEESVFEMVIRLTKIVDDSYPELMRAMWS